MVRLLLRFECMRLLCFQWFQSHNGAIAALFDELVVPLLREFQSHNGAIAALAEPPPRCVCSGFNPTMVRLLPLGLCVTEPSLP